MVSDTNMDNGRSPSGFDPSHLPDFNEVYDNQPACPTRDRQIEVCVVGRRCVYVNNFRVAGSKPYVSEGLSSHTLKAKLGDVLDAFDEREIRAALREAKERRAYFAAYYEAKRNAGRTAASPITSEDHHE
jgi:hypothetical protein